MKFLKKEIETLEKEMLRLIESHATYRRSFEILTSIPGIGKLSAIILIAGMPELGCGSVKEIAALAGVAPLNRDSGTWRGKSTIHGGRFGVRKALYMPAISVAPRAGDNPFQTVYQRLKDNGKPAKVALVAVMRKLLIVANALIKKYQLWKPDFA